MEGISYEQPLESLAHQQRVRFGDVEPWSPARHQSMGGPRSKLGRSTRQIWGVTN